MGLNCPNSQQKFAVSLTHLLFFFANCACRQCGKEFKPQELHAHMQSCRGFRERMRSSASASAQPSADGRRASTAGHRSGSAVFLLAEP